MKHSKTPWVLDKRGESLTSNGIPVCVWNLGLTWSARSKETEANAAFIVKAVNNHYKLLEGLKDIVQRPNQEALESAKQIIKQMEGEA